MRVLYLHGFASGPRSTKGLAFEQHFAVRGVAIERLDLRIPSLEHLRLSAMLEVVGSALGQCDEAVLILHGTRDDVVPIEYSRAFARLHPDVQLIELDDTHELIASLPRLLTESAAFLATIAP